MLDFLLLTLLGFLGSFGHCVGMCGPLTAAFSIAHKDQKVSIGQQLYYHGILNLARIASYVFVGGLIGAIGSVLIAGGQLAGIDSHLRQGFAIFTGLLLIWMGLLKLNPQIFPKIPFLHPFLQGGLHQQLGTAMNHFAHQTSWLTPALLGMAWGLMPCGFLYAAQVKAAESGNVWTGATTMLAFGLGTLPSMLGIGVLTSRMTADRRSQLSRLGGWVMLLMGGLALFRTSFMIENLTGHLSLGCLMLTLVARPVSRLWPKLLCYRRFFGVSAFVFAIAHLLQMIEHQFNWNLAAIAFMSPEHQWGLWAGITAVLLMIPLAVTSSNWMMRALGTIWHRIHGLTVPIFGLAVIHTLWVGSNYLGALQPAGNNYLAASILGGLTLSSLLIRQKWIWSLFTFEKFYKPIRQVK
jgi:uncharacterized protein